MIANAGARQVDDRIETGQVARIETPFNGAPTDLACTRDTSHNRYNMVTARA